MVDVPHLNSRLAVLTVVLNLLFSSEGDDFVCDLTVLLASDPATDFKTAVLECKGISNFSLRGFGGGLTQVTCLRVEDLRASQLDGLRYRVRDLQVDSFDLLCRHVELHEDSFGDGPGSDLRERN